MKRLLVPLDSSPLAETILPVAEEWAKEEQAELVLLRAVPPPERPAGEAAAGGAKTRDEAEAYLARVADRLARRGIERVRYVVKEEPPAAAITQVAREGAEMIAMATHGRGGLSRLVLGSVAEAVVRSVRVPVLLIRGQSAWKPWATRKILVPLDRSELSEGIVPMVERLAVPRGLRIILFHVIDPLALGIEDETTRPDHLLGFQREEGERYLAKVAEPLRRRGLQVKCGVQFGRVVETIAAFAGQEEVDLIAMATHGRSGLGRLLLGSVAAGVLKAASVPVLLFKANGSPR